MVKHFFPFLVVFLLLVVSCRSIHDPPENKITEKPQPPILIMGKGIITAEKLSAFLLQNNRQLEPAHTQMLSLLYVEEASFEGVNCDIAFSQMCLETGFLKFGGLVTPDMNNFCGLGSTGQSNPDGSIEKGLSFPDLRTGVRAHIQHLKAYASTEPLNMELVNPRFHLIEAIFGRGIAPTIQGLTGRWATDPLYCQKITVIMQRMYDFAFA